MQFLRSERARPALAMLLGSLCFAVMACFVKDLARQYSLGEIVLYRSLVVLVLSWVMLRRAGHGIRPHLPRGIAAQVVVGVAGLALYFLALVKLPLATATSLNYLSSVWLCLMALKGRAHLPRKVVVGSIVCVILGFVGVALVLRPTVQGLPWLGAACGLASGLLAAIAYRQIGDLTQRGESPSRQVFWFSAGCCVVGAAWATLQGWHALSWANTGLLLGVGLLGATGQLLFTSAYAKGNQVTVASLQYVGVIYAWLLGIGLFDESLSLRGVSGIALIVVAAIACVRLRAKA